MKTIGVVGGGASGLMAAISAAKADKTAEVFVLEHKNMAGKKILSTGNGRCNLTNEYMESSCFRSDDMHSVKHIIGKFGYPDTCAFFEQAGLLTKSRNGYVYPRCNQASAVLTVLLEEAERFGIRIDTDIHVTGILQEKKGFCIFTDKKKYYADKVILAAGGKASRVLGSDGSGYKLAESFGHTLIPVVPALVQLKVQENPFAKAAGVRTDARIQAYEDGVFCGEDTGELQITAYGLSGIPTFQISRYIAKALDAGRQAEVVIDFLPEIEEEEFASLLGRLWKEKPDAEIGACLNGIFAEKLIPVLLKLADIRPHTWLRKLSEDDLQRIAGCCKRVSLPISGTNGFEHAQVCAGGVNLKEIDCETMESRLVKGLYLVGELLDADGICGGYNLQWAWATGYLAGIHAVR